MKSVMKLLLIRMTTSSTWRKTICEQCNEMIINMYKIFFSAYDDFAWSFVKELSLVCFRSELATVHSFESEMHGNTHRLP